MNFLGKKIVSAFRKSIEKVKYLIPSLRKLRLKLSFIFKKILKTEKTRDLSFQLWGHLYNRGAQN